MLDLPTQRLSFHGSLSSADSGGFHHLGQDLVVQTEVRGEGEAWTIEPDGAPDRSVTAEFAGEPLFFEPASPEAWQFGLGQQASVTDGLYDGDEACVAHEVGPEEHVAVQGADLWELVRAAGADCYEVFVNGAQRASWCP